MSVTDFSVNDEKLAVHGGTEQKKTRRHFRCFQAGICLLLVELCERFTFFEIVCNMIPFCTVKLGYSNHQAAILNLCLIGASILSRVFMEWLVDVYLERNKLIYASLGLHLLGTALLSVVGFPLEDFYIGTYHVVNNVPTKERNRLFHAALLTIPLGTGGIRAIVCPQGAYGLQKYGSKKPMSLFNWVSWFTNLTTAIVFLGISYIQLSVAWAVAILLPSLSVFITLITLHMMYWNLIYQPEKHCALLTVFKVFAKALKAYCLRHCPLGRDWTSWLDHPMERNGHCSEFHVKDTRSSFSILLPLFTFQLIYRMCTMQTPSGYYLQTMNSNLNLGGYLLPIALMNAISILPLLILVPFMDYFSTCCLPSKRDGPFLSACIIAGNLSAALSVMVAGFLEIHRKLFSPVEQPLSEKLIPVSSMAWFCLVPQYVLLGVAEALVNPAFYMIVHRCVPSTFRETSRTFLTLFHGFACFSGALLVELVYLISEGDWFPNTLNKGHLESFFFLLAFLALLNVLGFWSVSQRYFNLNHFNVHGSNCEETLLLCEKSLRFYGSIQDRSSTDLQETAL